jgi:hypothetical protein
LENKHVLKNVTILNGSFARERKRLTRIEKWSAIEQPIVSRAYQNKMIDITAAYCWQISEKWKLWFDYPKLATNVADQNSFGRCAMGELIS